MHGHRDLGDRILDGLFNAVIGRASQSVTDLLQGTALYASMLADHLVLAGMR